jgi:hypothetical protein
MELRRATVRSFNPGPYTASVQILGSRSAYLDAVPVSRGLPAAELLPGRDCVVVLFEPTDPTDAMVVGVH